MNQKIKLVWPNEIQILAVAHARLVVAFRITPIIITDLRTNTKSVYCILLPHARLCSRENPSAVECQTGLNSRRVDRHGEQGLITRSVFQISCVKSRCYLHSKGGLDF